MYNTERWPQVSSLRAPTVTVSSALTVHHSRLRTACAYQVHTGQSALNRWQLVATAQ